MMKYLEYVMTNIEPVRIANLFTCKSGEITTLNYIPGSTMRGLLIGELSRELDFEKIRKVLLSDHIRFLNVYPSIGGVEMIPAPKGFYEHKKQDGRLHNVLVTRTFDDGMKRAKLGSFCMIQDQTIKYLDVEQAEVLNIDVNKKENGIFRSDMIQAGQMFKGYIAFDEDGMCASDNIKEVLETHTLRVGSKRSAGYGSVLFSEVKYMQQSRPYERYSGKHKQVTYLYLLSNTVMRDENGEICGLNLKDLEKKMGISELEIDNASTSIVRMSGVNRTWGARTPEVPMYEAGNVFKLKYTGTVDALHLERIEDEGIGIRKSEGCGRILFLDNYADIDKKEKLPCRETIEIEECIAEEDVHQVLKIAAEGILKEKMERAMEKYILQHPLDRGPASRNQAGVVLEMCKNLRYRPEQAKCEWQKFVEHENDKRRRNSVHNQSKSDTKDLHQFISDILKTPLIELLGLGMYQAVCTISLAELLSETKQIDMKLKLIENMIGYANREGKNE